MKNLQRPTLVALALCIVQGTMAQSPKTEGWLSSPGVVGTMVLLGIVLFIAVLIIAAKVSRLIQQTKEKRDAAEGNPGATDEQQARRDAALHYRLRGDELGGTTTAFDDKALIVGATSEPENPLVDEKIYSGTRLDTPPELRKIVLWYLGAATFWLVFGTLVGQYLGMKFVWPDLDEVAWLSFGRLRPVHTNTVFWGWASLAMIGLGYFVIARTSNTVIHSYKNAWRAWWLINLSVVIGNLCLMAGHQQRRR
jgi:cytochrome c oxidase cbb3-type subunit 1